MSRIMSPMELVLLSAVDCYRQRASAELFEAMQIEVCEAIDKDWEKLAGLFYNLTNWAVEFYRYI